MENQLKIYSTPYQITDFIQLKKDEKLDGIIEDKKRQIKTAELHNEIIRKSSLSKSKTLLEDIKWSDIQNGLSTTLSSIESLAISQVETHKNNLKEMIKDCGESWIAVGYEVSQGKQLNKKCPFCLQSLNNSEIFKAYQQYFNKEYNSLQKIVKSYKEFFDNINIESELSSVELSISNNETLCQFWKDHISENLIDENVLCAEEKTKIIDLFKSVKVLVSNKINNILQAVNVSQVDNLIAQLNTVNKKIDFYNILVDKINSAIDKIKTAHPLDIDSLQSDLKCLEANKKRFEDATNAICEEYIKNKILIEDANSKKEEKQQDLSRYSEEIFKDYSDKINFYLEKFNVNFRISRFVGVYRGTSKEPSAEYVIQMAGENIKFEDDGSSYTVKETLSEGDKSSLAFAFFLARLDLDKNLKEKILVLDDPLSSLDTARRRRTIEYIEELSKKVKQTIVLSHHDNFVYWLYKTEPFKISKTLQIKDRGDICNWDIEKDMQHEYFAVFAKIEDYIKDSSSLDKDTAKKQIRICLENDLKFRFHSYLKQPCTKRDGGIIPPINASSSLGDIIQKLEYSSCNFRCSNKSSIIQELNNLNKFCREDLHGKGDIAHVSERAQDSEIQGYLKSTIELIEKKL